MATPDPAQADKLLIQRLAGELEERTLWLAILITHFGRNDNNVFQLTLAGHEVSEARNLLRECRVPGVSIDYDIPSDMYILDAL